MIAYGCQDIESDWSVTADQLTTWNTWLGSNCDLNLYANLDSGEIRPVCIGVNDSVPVGTATAPPTTKTSQTGTVTTASTVPTATGIVANCQKFYTVQPGDTCYNIETIYGITFSQFYQWNLSGMFSSLNPHPSKFRLMHGAVGSNCENLWLGYAYCVEGPASTGGSLL